MDIDSADLLMEVMPRRASDLHLAAGAHPTVRVRGRLTPMDGYPKLSASDTREIIYSILTGDQRQRLETNMPLEFAHPPPRHQHFLVNPYTQRRAMGAAPRPVPSRPTLHDDPGPQPSVPSSVTHPRA